MSQDKCVKADMVCVQGEDNKAKTVIKMENYCEAKNMKTGCQEEQTGNKTLVENVQLGNTQD